MFWSTKFCIITVLGVLFKCIQQWTAGQLIHYKDTYVLERHIEPNVADVYRQNNFILFYSELCNQVWNVQSFALEIMAIVLHLKMTTV